MSAELLAQPAAAIAAAVQGGTATPVTLVAAAFARSRDVGAGREGLNAFVSGDEPSCVAAATDASRTGALAGVPVALKDNIATPFLTTSCGSKVLEGYVSPFEATAARKLREAGAVLVGKTTMDEFAMGSSTEHSAFGPARNPVDRERVPGGSSGGSAVAVAAGICPIALGSETGGSVRQPAAFCGIVGVKPTYGRISRFGLVAFASSLDNVGIFGRTVDDAALAMEVVSGPDTLRDATSAALEAPALRSAERDLKGMVIGRPREYFPASLDASMRERCERAVQALRARGAEVRDVSLPHTELAIPAYYIIAPAECSANLARFDGVRYGLRIAGDGLRAMYEATRSAGFGPEVMRRVLLGTYVLSAGYYDAYYRKAMQVRELIRKDFADVFASGVHALFTPTTPTPAFKFGELSDPYEMYLSDIFTVTANLAEVPAMSLPIGRVRGLPVGGQVIAPRFGEAQMFRVAYSLEAELGAEAHQ
jgi:aspartyl-tRNA(Asn)/glutamyl-tRNA(Gln) amidotransferase subunit A